ncbi:peptidase c14 [Fusarium langsethiae]|uniref:Protein SERAC1 n=1 Tax=Fusarium langsethiae TaxID=179993 RepID=A0A0N0DB20_FUSLA|nr:peptidase c14 [Fusarium langsethiae]
MTSSRRKLRDVGLRIIYDPSNTKNPQNTQFEIVAVHGLGAHPTHTWEGKPVDKDHPKPHLLRDLLSHSFPTAKILSFAYNSDWLVDAPQKTEQQIGQKLLEDLVEHRGDSQRLPIIFMGHSFGGIVIKEALCAAEESSNILEDTCGIIFLGTPHQGSSLSITGALLSRLTKRLGSNDTLLLNLRRNHSHLSDLEDRFRPLVKHKPVLSFYETKPTYLLRFSVGCIVDRESARGYSAEPVGIDTNHAGLNKFGSPEHPGYQALKAAIGRLQVKSLLEQADDHIRDKHYIEDKLKIQRLSGKPLSLEQCYINLAIVEQTKTKTSARDRSGEDDSVPRSSPFSLLARQKVDMPGEHAQLQLTDIFNRRKRSDDTEVSPRRILIRGRAGVGKTTLCKKMVHNFIRNKIWSDLFDRVLWVPLRNLKLRAGLGYDLRTLFDHEFFQFSGEDKKDGTTRFAKELYKALTRNRTLFILDGWDEVAGTDKNNDMFGFLRELLSQSNVIITSRPSAALPHGIEVDLELETIGFSPEQVDVYIDKVHGENMDELKAFLRSHELVRGLVRIPIQLDAFCYCWNDIGSGRDKKPDTMTTLYQAIQTSLWRKDAVRLEKENEGQRITAESLRPASQTFVEKHVEGELQFLEHLAFAGLAADKIEFELGDRNVVHDYLRLSFPLDRNLQRLSFLRTSDPSAEPEHQLYHFIHLTFQEYFAARYFVRHWTANAKMSYIAFDFGRAIGISPVDFLKKHKYDVGYDIMWRFVAGLLDGADKRQTSRPELSGSDSHGPDSARFFEEIEKEPVDLLGPTHQRLVMHCLSEAISLPKEIRAGREERLVEWVLFESDFTRSSGLARESELPDQVLCAALSRSQDKKVLLNGLAYSGRYLSQMVVSALVDLFKDDDRWVRSSAAEAVGKQSTLSDTTMRALVDLFKHDDSGVRGSAANAVGNQQYLMNKVLDASGLLVQSKSHPDKQVSVAHHLHYIEPLYMNLLRRGFSEQFSLYRGDNLLTINQLSGLRTAALDKEDLLQVWVLNGRLGLKGIKGYNLWGPLVGSGCD